MKGGELLSRFTGTSNLPQFKSCSAKILNRVIRFQYVDIIAAGFQFQYVRLVYNERKKKGEEGQLAVKTASERARCEQVALFGSSSATSKRSINGGFKNNTGLPHTTSQYPFFFFFSLTIIQFPHPAAVASTQLLDSIRPPMFLINYRCFTYEL